MENFADEVDADMGDTFKPLLREWKSVQELAGLPVPEDDPILMAKLNRETSFSTTDLGDDSSEPKESSLQSKRAASVGNGISLTDFGRRRIHSEKSMDTLWSSSSTFSINIDADEGLQSNYSLNVGSSDAFLDGSQISINEQRERTDTISEVQTDDQDGSSDVDALDVGGELDKTTESLETVMAEDTPRPDRTEEEVKALMEDIVQRMEDTCKQLSSCVYEPEDTEDDIVRKLESCKVKINTESIILYAISS